MPDVGRSYKQHPPAEVWDAIVVGSGMGGLASAAILSKLAHRRVLVLERHYTAGGYTHAFHRPGYEWDVGVHYIGQVGARSSLRPFFDYISGGKLEWAPLPDVYDRIILGNRSYDFVTGPARFAARMKDYFPREAGAIDRYLALVKKMGKRGLLYFGERALPAPLGRFAGPLMRAPYMRYAGRTTGEVLSQLTDDPELRAVLAGQYGDYGLPPSQSSFAIHAAVVGHYLGGAWYPVGGAAAIARTIEPVINASGGEIFVNADVAEVVVSAGRAIGVKMADGRLIHAPIVISDAGVRLTHERLLPKSAPPPAALRASVSEVGPSSAHACLYIGLKHTDAELGLTGTNLWIYPDADHDRNIARYAADPSGPLPLVYASFPSAKDPSFAERHPGRATIDLVTVAPWSRFAEFDGTRWRKRGNDYDARKNELAEKMLEALYTQLPQVRGKIDVQELSTPVTTKHFAAHPFGELYGLDHGVPRYRMPIRAETHVPGLFLTGADLVSAGVAGALFGGVLTATAILKKNVPAVITASAKRALPHSVLAGHGEPTGRLRNVETNGPEIVDPPDERRGRARLGRLGEPVHTAVLRVLMRLAIHLGRGEIEHVVGRRALLPVALRRLGGDTGPFDQTLVDALVAVDRDQVERAFGEHETHRVVTAVRAVAGEGVTGLFLGDGADGDDVVVGREDRVLGRRDVSNSEHELLLADGRDRRRGVQRRFGTERQARLGVELGAGQAEQTAGRLRPGRHLALRDRIVAHDGDARGGVLGEEEAIRLAAGGIAKRSEHAAGRRLGDVAHRHVAALNEREERRNGGDAIDAGRELKSIDIGHRRRRRERARRAERQLGRGLEIVARVTEQASCGRDRVGFGSVRRVRLVVVGISGTAGEREEERERENDAGGGGHGRGPWREPVGAVTTSCDPNAQAAFSERWLKPVAKSRAFR